MWFLSHFCDYVINFNTHTDNALIIDTQDGEGNTIGLNDMDIALIRLPESILSITDDDDDINLAFTLYSQAVFFPVRGSPPNTIVGSSVISARVGGIADGTELPEPVVISLALKTAAVGY